MLWRDGILWAGCSCVEGSEVSDRDRCELFAVGKDETKDRQILHRKRRNLRERHVVGVSRDLPHASVPAAS